MSSKEAKKYENKAGYTAELVACDWAGAVMRKLPAKRRERNFVIHRPTNQPTIQPTNQPTKLSIERLVDFKNTYFAQKSVYLFSERRNGYFKRYMPWLNIKYNGRNAGTVDFKNTYFAQKSVYLFSERRNGYFKRYMPWLYIKYHDRNAGTVHFKNTYFSQKLFWISY